MDTTTQNPPPSLPLPHPPQQTQALPPITHITALTNPMPETKDTTLPYTSLPIRAPDPRDSGNWSQSKHSSGVSNNGIQLQSILNSEDSPSRNSVPETPLSAKPTLHPPPQQLTQQLPSINSGFDPRSSLDATSLLDSRRSSVDSRMNAGISHLAISPSSPYDSQNVSRTSLVSNLQQQRGITTDVRTNGSGPISPIGQRTGLRPAAAPRRAPIINPNPRSVSGMPDPTAAAPTKGFPWAFPDQQELPDGQRRSSSSSLENRPSRQNSFAASVNSSIITVDSSLPPGQKRFSEDMQHTHHHTLQHRSISSVQSGDLGPGGAAGSYSRTPELRISHKMAERKRRSEMKNLFDELNQILPANTGGKSSKWEVLTRAIDYIKQQKHDVQRLSDIHRDATNLRTEIEKSRQENSMLREEVNSLWQSARRLEPNVQHVVGPYTSQLAAHEQAPQSQPPQPQAQPQPQPTALPRSLPPPQTHWNQGSNMMQGVEYQPGQSFERR